MKKTITITLIISLMFFIMLIIFDLINITKIIPLSYNYDWLGFIGTFISGVATLILGIVSIKQNGFLSEANKKILGNDMISNCFSKIDIEKENYMDYTSDTYTSDNGLKMSNVKPVDNNNYYHKLIIQMSDTNDLPLSLGHIKELKIEYTDEFSNLKENFIYKPVNDNYIKLEVTPKTNKMTYYLPICLLDNPKNLKEIEKENSLRITFIMSIKNSFNVVSTNEYTIILNKGNKIVNSDWIQYSLSGRKIYFKNITYEE